jgi:hypothetical protein
MSAFSGIGPRRAGVALDESQERCRAPDYPTLATRRGDQELGLFLSGESGSDLRDRVAA